MCTSGFSLALKMRDGVDVMLVAGTVAGADVGSVVAFEPTDVGLVAVREQHGPLVPRAAPDERVVRSGAYPARRAGVRLRAEVERVRHEPAPPRDDSRDTRRAERSRHGR
jgi:hypothetical protein